jgi:iron(III) transport system substrate-binding protein
VFWSGDPVRAAVLKSKGVSEAYFSPQAQWLPALYSDPEGHWVAFSARARVLIYNRDLVAAGNEPKSVMDLLDPRFKGRACIANPLFGTTSMHAAALFQVLGEEKARQFFRQFIENGGVIVSSNGEVRRRVAAGDFALGLTDTDDFNVAFQEGKPVGAVYPDAGGIGTLIVPNAAVLIRGGPNPDRGRQFIDYLLRPATEQALAESEAAQMPLRTGVKTPAHIQSLETITPMKVDYGTLANLLQQLSAGFLKEWVEANSP